MIDPAKLASQLQKQRRTVDFDTFDIVIQQLMNMVESKRIDIAPAYQRQFRWDNVRCSQLVESVFLGIPVPSLYMATNRDGTWELVDGVQRLSAILKFAGNEKIRTELKIGEPLKLEGLDKLTEFDGMTYAALPQQLQVQFELRPIKVVTLSDKSDRIVRFDLFERLNKGGVQLTQQEIRDCVYRGKFSETLDSLAKNKDFRKVIRLTAKQQTDGTQEECVLRFFALLFSSDTYVHSVSGFLNDYMEAASSDFDYAEGKRIFKETFKQLVAIFPQGLSRPEGRKTTPLSLYEGVSVGAAKAIMQAGKLKTEGVDNWIDDPQLRQFTTGATNDLKSVLGRIKFCEDKFLGQ